MTARIPSLHTSYHTPLTSFGVLINLFSSLTYEAYTTQSPLRRNLKRWVENLVNASFDIAKILLACEKQLLPQTYRETLLRLKTLKGFQEPWVEKLAERARLRNILAHEYTDIRFKYLAEFISSAATIYHRYIQATENFIANSLYSGQE
mgnify:CR=1 FL=1